MRTMCGWLRDERGVALIMALVVILILTAIILAVSEITISDLGINALVQDDTRLQYLAQAAAEHQIYLLKSNIDAGAVASTNYPVLAGETPGWGRYWYLTTVTCTADCTSLITRSWAIEAFGELRRYDGSWTLLQQRPVRVKVQITYAGGSPTSVTLTEWTEVSP